MKKLLAVIFLIVCVVIYANTQIIPIDLEGSRVDPGAVHTPRIRWAVIDETTSTGTEPTDLAVTERTYQLVKAAIDTADSGDDEISVFDVPRSWNGIRVRAVSITDAGSVVYGIYAGTLGDGNKDSDSTGADCDLAYVGTFTFTTGTQLSIYHQITFTSGGVLTPQAGDVATGNSSAETAVVVSTTISSGTFAAGTAAGTVQYTTKSGTFTNSETITLTRLGNVVSADAYTHAASDLVGFELADTLVVTQSDWTVDMAATGAVRSPTGNRVAEARFDLLGADVLVLVPTTASVDCKLLVRGL